MGIFPPIVVLGIVFVMLAIKLFAFISSLLYSAQAYDAAGKLTKTTWCAILGTAVGLDLLGLFVPIGFFLISLALFIAALVYLADVRPALAGLRRR